MSYFIKLLKKKKKNRDTNNYSEILKFKKAKKKLDTKFTKRAIVSFSITENIYFYIIPKYYVFQFNICQQEPGSITFEKGQYIIVDYIKKRAESRSLLHI